MESEEKISGCSWSVSNSSCLRGAPRSTSLSNEHSDGGPELLPPATLAGHTSAGEGRAVSSSVLHCFSLQYAVHHIIHFNRYFFIRDSEANETVIINKYYKNGLYLPIKVTNYSVIINKYHKFYNYHNLIKKLYRF